MQIVINANANQLRFLFVAMSFGFFAGSYLTTWGIPKTPWLWSYLRELLVLLGLHTRGCGLLGLPWSHSQFGQEFVVMCVLSHVPLSMFVASIAGLHAVTGSFTRRLSYFKGETPKRGWDVDETSTAPRTLLSALRQTKMLSKTLFSEDFWNSADYLVSEVPLQ